MSETWLASGLRRTASGTIVDEVRGADDGRLLWIISAVVHMPTRALGLVVAPAGKHRPFREVFIDAGSPAWRALGATRGDDPQRLRASLLGRRLVLGRRPVVAPPPIAGTRPVLLIEAPVRAPWGAMAMHAACGDRLARAVGMADVSQLLLTFEVMYLGRFTDSGDSELARRAELFFATGCRMNRRPLVVLGGRASAALRAVAGVTADAPIPGLVVTGELPTTPRSSSRRAASRPAGVTWRISASSRSRRRLGCPGGGCR